MTQTYKKLALLALLAIPAAAQTERPQVVFNVQIVQANQIARNAMANARERQAADFNRDDEMSIHVLNEQTDAAALVSGQRNANALDIVSLPKMTTTAGQDAHFLIGGRFPVPSVDAPGNSGGNSNGNGSGNGNGNGNNPNAPDPTLNPNAPQTEFGIRLTMRPTPLPDGRLRVRVTPRVQTVDFENATERGGRFIPALVTRQTSRAVDLSPGQSFAITGVINSEVIKQIRRIPGLETKRLMQSLLAAGANRPNSQLVLLVTPKVLPIQAD